MGYVRVEGVLGDMTREKLKGVTFVADTGAFYTVIPPAVAKELNIKPLAKTKLILADKREVEADVSLAYIKILDREGVFQVAIMEVPEPLLGVTTLEGLGLRVNPTTGKLEYSRPYGAAIL